MSEKSIAELIESLRRQSPGTAEHYATVEMLDARIARAEAAERMAEAYIAWIASCELDLWDDLCASVKAYKAAKEAVRKLEEAQ